MSIVTEIESNRAKRVAMSNTKQDIKSAVNTDFEAINNEQIEQYPNLIRNAINQYKSYIPVVTGEGKQLSLNTVPLKMKEFAVKGNTFQQQYEGTQLIGFDDTAETTIKGITYSIKDNVFTVNGTATDNVRYIYNNHWKLKSAGNYNLKIEPISGTWTAGIMGLSLRKANYTQSTYHQVGYNDNNLSSSKEYTDTQIQETVGIGFYINANSVFSNYKFRIIYNEGSTALDYEPYVGGTPAPNPDYPQDIKVVTGEQTVHIGDTTKTLNLGNMELCKIDTYQDILFKNTTDSAYYNAELDLDAWYKKKAIQKAVLNGTEAWSYGNKPNGNCEVCKILNYFPSNVSANYFSSHFIYNETLDESKFVINGRIIYLRLNNKISGVTSSDDNDTIVTKFETWLTNNNVLFYYILATPTYTKITDTTLINQLEAIENTNMNEGTTIIYAVNEEGLQPTLYMEAYAKVE